MSFVRELIWAQPKYREKNVSNVVRMNESSHSNTMPELVSFSSTDSCRMIVVAVVERREWKCK